MSIPDVMEADWPSPIFSGIGDIEWEVIPCASQMGKMYHGVITINTPERTMIPAITNVRCLLLNVI
jgi:hypothetical protein